MLDMAKMIKCSANIQGIKFYPLVGKLVEFKHPATLNFITSYLAQHFNIIIEDFEEYIEHLTNIDDRKSQNILNDCYRDYTLFSLIFYFTHQAKWINPENISDKQFRILYELLGYGRIIDKKLEDIKSSEAKKIRNWFKRMIDKRPMLNEVLANGFLEEENKDEID